MDKLLSPAKQDPYLHLLAAIAARAVEEVGERGPGMIDAQLWLLCDFVEIAPVLGIDPYQVINKVSTNLLPRRRRA